MTRIFSILMGVFMLSTGMTISIDRHFCGGELAGTKISVSGKLASCGMETIQHSCPTLPSINVKCCDDQLTFYSISTKYLPEYPKLSFTPSSKDIQTVTEYTHISGSPYLASYNKWELPPGEKVKSAPELSEICVYRI